MVTLRIINGARYHNNQYVCLIQGGKTPLYIAARGSFTAIVDMIIKTARLEYKPKVGAWIFFFNAINK